MKTLATLSTITLLCLGAAPAAAAGDAPAYQDINREGGQTLRALFDEALASAKRAKKPVLVMFTSDWCAPCISIKDHLLRSERVQDAARGGHLLLIDVDEWRGPAQKLLPGINARKLPTLVNVGWDGAVKLTTYGSQLGLLSEEWTAKNLSRAFKGKAPLVPDYESNPRKRRELAVKIAKRNAERMRGLAPVELRVQDREGMRRGVHLTIRNADGRRRWFALPAHAGDSIREQWKGKGWTVTRFDEHIRANYITFHGADGADLMLFAVASHGSVEIGHLPLELRDGAQAVEILELDRVTLNDKTMQFEKKVPHQLKIEDARKSRVVNKKDAPVELLLKVRRRFEQRVL